MRALFLDYATVSFNGDLDPAALRRALSDLELRDHTAQDDVAEAVAGAAVILVNKLRITREIMERAPALELIALAATGTNNVDLEAARERGIAVCNLRDYCTASVVQHVFGVLLALTHRLREYDALVRSGAWQRGGQFCLLDFPIRELAGRKLGIVGFGTLGRGVAHAARAFGMEVLVANRPGGEPVPGRIDLDELLPQVDVLSLHCPLTPATDGIISRVRLQRMKPDAVLDQHRPRRAGGLRRAGGRAARRPARRRGHRRAAPGTAGGRQPAARGRRAEPHRHAAHRLGSPRGAAALHRRDGGERRGLPARWPARPRGVTGRGGSRSRRGRRVPGYRPSAARRSPPRFMARAAHRSTGFTRGETSAMASSKSTQRNSLCSARPSSGFTGSVTASVRVTAM